MWKFCLCDNKDKKDTNERTVKYIPESVLNTRSNSSYGENNEKNETSSNNSPSTLGDSTSPTSKMSFESDTSLYSNKHYDKTALNLLMLSDKRKLILKRANSMISDISTYESDENPFLI